MTRQRNLGLRSRGMSTWDPSQHETPSRLYRPALINLPHWFWVSALAIMTIGVGIAVYVG